MKQLAQLQKHLFYSFYSAGVYRTCITIRHNNTMMEDYSIKCTTDCQSLSPASAGLSHSNDKAC